MRDVTTFYSAHAQAKQKEEFAQRSAFVARSPLFEQWPDKMRKLLEINLEKREFDYGATIVRQGEAMKGLFFIIKCGILSTPLTTSCCCASSQYCCCRGEAKIVVDASTHEAQFPKLFDPNNSILARELGTYAIINVHD